MTQRLTFFDSPMARACRQDCPSLDSMVYLFIFFVKYIRGLKKVPVGDPGPRGHITPLHREKGELSPKDVRLGPGGLVKAYDLAW